MSQLTEAIAAGDAARVAALIDGSPEAASAVENGVTPLMFALYQGKPDLARLIAGRLPRLSFPEAAAIGDRERVERMLAEDPSLLDGRSADGFPPLGLAIFFRQPAVARFLIEQGADVNAPADNAQRVTPLHAAAAVQDLDTMRLLLERGADANAKQQMDYRPLHTAASRGDVEMARLLLAHGAERDARGTDGLGVAEVARKYGKGEFAEWWEGGQR